MVSDLGGMKEHFLNPLFPSCHCFILAFKILLPASEGRKLIEMKIDFNRNYLPITVGRSSSFSCSSKILCLSFDTYVCISPLMLILCKQKINLSSSSPLLLLIWNWSRLSEKALPLSEPPLSPVPSLGSLFLWVFSFLGSVQLCLYVCIYMCLSMCVHVWIHMYICVFAYVCFCVCLYTLYICFYTVICYSWLSQFSLEMS